jgi:hypothetical protein
MPKYRILRQIPEVFVVEAETYEAAIEQIADGMITESESMSDTYELLDETNEEEVQGDDKD